MSFLYVLTYPSKFEARFDATLVGHTAMGEVLIYFSGNVPEAPATSVAPVPGYSVMVQAAMLDDSLLADPNLTFALNMRRVQARQRGIVQSIYSDAVMAGLVLVFSNFGLLVQGLVV
jgi:hypothetical protein